jgi:hypothetical protein
MAVLITSPLRLENDSSQSDDAWWSWSIWVEGPEEELDRIRSVTYRLHPSFPVPVQSVRDRTTRFRLHGSGWGEFMVKADVRLSSKEVVSLERWLELRDANGNRLSDRAGAGGRRPSVFISASAMDGDFVDELSEALRNQGIVTIREQDLTQPGSTAFTAVSDAVRESDGVVAVFSTLRSGWVEKELELGRKFNKPSFPVVLGDTPLPSAANGLFRFELTDPHNVAGLANTIAARLKDDLIQD